MERRRCTYLGATPSRRPAIITDFDLRLCLFRLTTVFDNVLQPRRQPPWRAGACRIFKVVIIPRYACELLRKDATTAKARRWLSSRLNRNAECHVERRVKLKGPA